jgi:hypothetical protein
MAITGEMGNSRQFHSGEVCSGGLRFINEQGGLTA